MRTTPMTTARGSPGLVLRSPQAETLRKYKSHSAMPTSLLINLSENPCW